MKGFDFQLYALGLDQPRARKGNLSGVRIMASQIADSLWPLES